jgi:hypothetical protein
VKFQSFAELGDTQLVIFTGELLEDVEGVGDGLNDVVGLLSAHASLQEPRKRRFS